MTLETSLIDSALRNWRSNVDRAGKLFGNLSQEQLLQEVAPGKNRVIYLWGHLTAFNDALIPLLGFGARIHPELDLMFVSNPDRTVPTILLGEDLKIIWQETSQILWTGFSKLSVADWLQKHGAVSGRGFLAGAASQSVHHSTGQNGAYRLSLRPGKALGESANVGHELKRVRRYA